MNMKIKDKLIYFLNDHGIVWMPSPPDDFEARAGYPVRESDYPTNKLVEKVEIWAGLLPKHADIDSYNEQIINSNREILKEFKEAYPDCNDWPVYGYLKEIAGMK